MPIFNLPLIDPTKMVDKGGRDPGVTALQWALLTVRAYSPNLFAIVQSVHMKYMIAL
jgi:hypothetical protein